MSTAKVELILLAPGASPFVAAMEEVERVARVFSVEVVTSVVEAAGRSFERPAAVVLVDVAGFGDSAVAELARGAARPRVVALVTGDTEALAARAMRAGAVDYVAFDLEPAEATVRRLLRVAAPGAARQPTAASIDAVQSGVDLLFSNASRLLAIFERAPIGLAIGGLDSHILIVNAAFASMLGYEPAELAGKHFESLTHPDDVARQLPFVDAVVGGTSDHYQIEKRYRRRDNSYIWMSLSVSLVRDESDRPAFTVALTEDITSRKEAEERRDSFMRVEKQRALAQMASGVAHDLNQHLGLVVGHSELAQLALDRPNPDVGHLHESLRVIMKAALDAADDVRRLQAFARSRQEGKPTLVDLGVLLRDVARETAGRWRDQPAAEGRSVRLDVNADRDAAFPVLGWEESLREALSNLIVNAADALPNGGMIRLRARRAGGEIEVEVADDGVGMPPDVQRRAFEPFFSTKGSRGSGLGLSIVFAVVQRHRGQVALETAEGAGTTVRLTLPAAPDEAKPEPPAAAGGKLRLLAVDDEPAMAELLATMLRVEGHAVTTVLSAEAALDRLAAGPFDAVFSDLGLGEGMTGWELAARVRERWPHTRFILTTGWGAEIDPDDAARRGVQAVVSKPYRLDAFRRILATNPPD